MNSIIFYLIYSGIVCNNTLFCKKTKAFFRYKYSFLLDEVNVNFVEGSNDEAQLAAKQGIW